MIRLSILNYELFELDLRITQYANDNIKDIIRCFIDYLEDNDDISYCIYINTACISQEEWTKMVYALYDMVCSTVMRDYIKPKYQYLLYQILLWWQGCQECCDNDELLMYDLDEELADLISANYPSEDSENEDEENYMISLITNYENYLSIFFYDYDFLPDVLSALVSIYLRSNLMFETYFYDVDLDEYRELMPRDLMELYDDSKICSNNSPNDSIEDIIYKDIMFCCEKVQADYTLKDALENKINDRVRDLLEAKKYDVKDQTRHGTSAGGKDAGNVDIFIKMNNFPITLIEALCLDSVRKKYIFDHIKKVYTYDTLGQKFNYLVSYVKTADFNEFCKKYNEYVSGVQYPYNLIRIYSCDEKQFPEIRTIEVILDREGVETKLYHILIHLAQ